MALKKITSPVVKFTGVVGNVQFVDSVAIIDDKVDEAALQYFERHAGDEGYKIEVGHKADAETPAKTSTPSGKPKLSAAEKKAAAAAVDNKVGDKGATATEQQAGIESTSAVSVAGDGPAGPVHNSGRDGADPDNTGAGIAVPESGI